MYILKETPEDFIVVEIAKNLEIKDCGDYCYFTIEKRNRNTADVVKEIAGKLGIRERNFNVAGVKDKKAVTIQHVSGFNVKRERLERLKIAGVKIKFAGYGDERIRLGQIKENKFRIVVRGLEEPFSFGKRKPVEFIENYYDEQRFSGRNALLGRALVKKEFRRFCFMLRLKWKEGDYINAIRTVQKKRLVFYINAYQSLLWNRAVAEHLKRNLREYFKVDYSEGEMIFSEEKLENKKISVIGYNSCAEGELKEIYDVILKEEKIKKDDFIIKEIPELISEGAERDLYCGVKDFKFRYGKDEKHKGKLKAELEFSLGAGAYATIVVKKMFS